MRKFLIFLGVLIGLIIVSLVLVPILFKDDIKAALDKELDKSLNAKVVLNEDKLSLSLIKDFPDVSVTIGDFAIINKAPFEGDTLFYAGELNAGLNLFSLFGDQIQINKIGIKNPVVNILYNKDGAANYDITKSTGEAENPADSSASSVDIGIQQWSIENGRVVYWDQGGDMKMVIEGLNHQGSGDFSKNIFDMETSSSIDALSFWYEGDNYLNRKKVQADIIMAMDLDNMKFTFKDNTVKLNDFAFGFDGFFAMPTDDYQMDIKFASQDNSFKSLLSLVPGMYSPALKDLDTKGTLAFNGFVKGIYNDNTMPAYGVNLEVKNGYVKSTQVPLPVEQIMMAMKVNSSDGTPAHTTIDIPNFSMKLDKDKFTANAHIQNLDNPSWKLKADGTLNLDMLGKFVPESAYKISGQIVAALETEGNYAAIENEQYDKIKANGSLQMNRFQYEDADYGTLEITKAVTSFNPKEIRLADLSGKIQDSDFKVSGYLQNYLAYALEDNAVLTGQMQLTSSKLNLNPFMTSDSAATETADTAALEVVEIPKNIDFTFDATMDKVLYDNLELNDMRGTLLVKDGILKMKDLRFNTLGGKFAINGAYNSQDIAQPFFNMDLKIEDLSIPKAYKNFVTVQKLAPIAQAINGNFSTDFAIGGMLQQDMMPDLTSLTGAGLFKIVQASVTQNSKLVSGITSLTKLKGADQVSLKDVIMNAEIKDGRLFVKPFDVKFGDYKATVGGSNGIDGSLDYNVSMKVPTGAAGQAANQAIASLLGNNKFSVGDEVTLNFAVGGNYNDPKVKLGKTTAESSGGNTATQAVKAKVKETVDKEKEKVKAEIDAKKAEAEQKLQQKKDSVQKALEKQAEQKKEELKKKAKKTLKNVLGGGGL